MNSGVMKLIMTSHHAAGHLCKQLLNTIKHNCRHYAITHGRLHKAKKADGL